MIPTFYSSPLHILLANKITAEAMDYIFPEEITKRLQLLGLVLSRSLARFP